MMRALIFCLVLFFSASDCGAQLSIIKTNPFSVFGGFVNGCYEKTINTKSSYQVSVYVGYDLDDVEGTALEANIGYRKYITKKDAPRGFYLMPYTGFAYTSSSSAVRIGSDLGYQWIWKNGIVLDAAMGPDYYLNFSDKEDEFFDGIGFNFVFTFGYSF
ncbi:MAG: hypothetical protein ACI86M_001561 [Saprospiraceae bacterium]|jgi:hypothetical protein